MQDQTIHTTHRREGVAARLKKSMGALGGAHVQNGTGPEKVENGCAPEPSNSVQLSETEKQVVRLVGQHLKSLGMHETAAALVHESGCKLENAAASRFRMHILGANWDMVLADLRALKVYLSNENDFLQMKFMILEQKYLELLERGKVVDALNVLRTELTPLNYNTDRVHQLSTFLMFNNSSELRTVAGWPGSTSSAREQLLDRLQSNLPASVMLPPRRLDTLLKQAMQWQHSKCPLHNSRVPQDLDPHSLLVDHTCSRVGFPCELRQCLTDHCDEVWCALFSNTGRLLATGAKESTVYIWELDPVTKTLRKYRTLEGHTYGAAFFAWAPNDKYLAVVGTEDGPDLWLWNVEKGELRVRMSQSPDDSLSAVSWHRDGNKLVCGGQKGQFYLCDLDGNVLESWEGIRIRSLWCKQDGRTVLAADTHHRIRSYIFDDLTDTTLIKESDPLIYFCLDLSERYALCTTKGQGLHLWDIEARSLVKRFRGSTHGEYIVVSCFGGENQDFVATGSEDGKIFLWHRDREDPVRILNGHAACVNAVSWNPVDPSVLVSCSDDGTVRLWGPEDTGANQFTSSGILNGVELGSTPC